MKRPKFGPSRPHKKRIPEHAMDGLIAQVRAARARATPPRTPEETRRDQELEHRLKLAKSGDRPV